jgi:hypothetical protein
MFKDTSFIILKRKDQSPHICHLGNPCILDLEIFVYLILKSSTNSFETILLMLKHTITQMQQS